MNSFKGIEFGKGPAYDLGVIYDNYSLSFNAITKALFANGEQGFAYDFSDFSTMFQDSAGTTPVTAAGQPVGLVLDKSKGLVLGAESISGAWNNPAGVWVYEGDNLRCTATTNSFNVATLSTPVTTGTWQKVQFRIYEVSSGNIRMRLRGSTTVATAQVNSKGLHTFFLYAPAGSIIVDLEPSFSIGFNGLIGDISVRELPGNHRFVAAAASRPTLRQNSTTGAYYLEYDGVDDYHTTNSVNFAGTDKVSVFSGVRKLSDAATGMLLELSATQSTNNGTFSIIIAGGGGVEEYTFGTRGTSSAFAATTSAEFNAPNSAVLTGLGNISGDSAILRINGAQVAQSTADQGTGNYGNYTLFFGRRGGTSLPFNGHEYSLIGIGRLTNDLETRRIEKMLASRIGVTLPS